MKYALAATLAAAFLTMSAPAEAAKKSCVLAGGDATMITPDLAKFMANAALNNSIKGMGATAAGDVKMTCAGPNPLTTCQARQRACK
jgi:hypothetical protein